MPNSGRPYGTQGRAARGSTGGGCDWARRKSSGVGREPVLNGSRQRASQVVLGIGMGARKSRTGQTQNGFHSCFWHAAHQQSFRNPQVGDAPIGTRKALRDLQIHEPGLIGCDGGSGVESIVMNAIERGSSDCRADLTRAGRLRRGTRGRGDQGIAVGSQTELSCAKSDPGRPATRQPALRLLIGESRQSSDMAPVGARSIATIELSQMASDLSCQCRCQRQ